MASLKQVVGDPTPRVEGELKVSGEAKYAVDIAVFKYTSFICISVTSALTSPGTLPALGLCLGLHRPRYNPTLGI